MLIRYLEQRYIYPGSGRSCLALESGYWQALEVLVSRGSTTVSQPTIPSRSLLLPTTARSVFGPRPKGLHKSSTPARARGRHHKFF